MAHSAFSLSNHQDNDENRLVTNIVQISRTRVSITTAAAVRWLYASSSTASASVYAEKATTVMDLPAQV